MQTNAIIFPKAPEETFLQELRQEVNQYFEKAGIDRFANRLAKTKALLLFSTFVCLYLGMLTAGNHLGQYLFCCSFLGPVSVFLALNVGHDAAHHTLSRKRHVNDILVNVFSLFGVSGYMWKMRHVHTHHVFPNIPGMDQDIGQSELARVHPRISWRNFHRWQHLYMPLLYLIYSLHWFLYRDFKDFSVLRFGARTLVRHPARAFWGMVLTKVLFLTALIGLPLWLTTLGIGWIALGFLLTEMMASLFVTFVLVASHVGEGAEFPVPNEKGEMPYSWALHQIRTTTDFATDNALITHLYGGFNHHVVHHLFPHVSHIHYPVLTQLLEKKLKAHQIPYAYHPTLGQALRAHHRHLVNLGRSGQPMGLYELEL